MSTIKSKDSKDPPKKVQEYIDRDISWLSFNERVLQEAEDKLNPLMERLKFLAIYSSNLEEFYEVRVARQKFSLSEKGNKPNKFGVRPSEVLETIALKVDQQQTKFGAIFKKVTKGLSKKGVSLFSPKNKKHRKFALKCFKKIQNELDLQALPKNKDFFLENKTVYLYVATEKKGYRRYHLVKVDYKKFGRFFSKKIGKKQVVIQLDDVIREGLKEEVFPSDFQGAYAVKISRDAELYLEDEDNDMSVREKIESSLGKRETGEASRLLFDENIPFKSLNVLMKRADLPISSLTPGGYYHNFYEFFSFPELLNGEESFDKLEMLRSKQIKKSSVLDSVHKQDVFLSFPYQDYSYIVKAIEEAAKHKDVEQINITLYRVASDSAICSALEQAAKSGKKVIVFTELKARFDEESNIYWNDRLKAAGAKVYDYLKGLKVHAKVFQIIFSKKSKLPSIAHLGTGNFNEKNAKIYADHSLLTSDPELNEETVELFKFLTSESDSFKTTKLLTSPKGIRDGFNRRIDREILHAKSGAKGYVLIKINSLEDPKVISKFYEASQAGVKIDLIVRGICCLKPEVKGLSENIKVISIVDRYLEHARCYYFHNDGDSELYCSSADFMSRNLDKRVEVAFPILESKHKKFLYEFMQIQLSDNVKGRLLDAPLNNYYSKGIKDTSVRSQYAVRDLITEMKM